MPAKSKAQQRFMGMVHAIQKGELSPDDVSDKVKDVADNMSDKDAEDFASTKHKGKPEHVPKEVIKKLRELIRMELESCGYTMSAEPPHKKLTSPGGLDDDLEEVSTTATAGGEYDTPNAFQSKGKEKRKRTAKMGTEFELVEGVKATQAYKEMNSALTNAIYGIKNFRKVVNDAPYDKKIDRIASELYKFEIDLEKKLRLLVPQMKKISADKRLESINEGVKATKSFNNILKARNEFIERYSKLRKQLNTLKTESPNNEILRLEKQLYKFEMAFIEQSSKLLGSVGKIAKSNLTEAYEMSPNDSKKLKLAIKRYRQQYGIHLSAIVKHISSLLQKGRFPKSAKEILNSYKKFEKAIDGVLVQHESIIKENSAKAVQDMISKGYVKRGQKDKHRVMGIGKWLDERAPKISAKYNDVWIRRIKMGRGGQVQDWWGDTMSMIKVRLREKTENIDEVGGLAFAVILRNLAKHAHKKRMYDKLKKKKRESVNEAKYVVYVDKDGKGRRGRKIVKSGLSQMGAKRLYNKLVKTDDYQEVGYDDHKSWNQNNIKKVNEDIYIGYYKNKKVKVRAKSDKEAQKQIVKKLRIPKKDYDIASLQNWTKTKHNKQKFEINEMSDKELLKYALYIRKYKPGLWNHMKKNSDMKKLIKKFNLEAVVEKIIRISKDPHKGVRNTPKGKSFNPLKLRGEDKIKALVWSGSYPRGKGSYELKGNKLNVMGLNPRDKGFYVAHFTKNTGIRRGNLYYDGVHWQGGKKF